MEEFKSQRKILIVDDDEINAKALGKRLERRGFDVTLVPQPDEIFHLIEKYQPELILMDIVMPQVDGITLLQKIRNIYGKNELPVIMVTAREDINDIINAFKFEANDYITKPVNIEVAQARIYAHLSVADLHREEIRKREIETIYAMVTTYNHEINNPLTIALGGLRQLRKNSPDLDQTSFDKTVQALNRIVEIVKKIRETGESTRITFDPSAGGSGKMVKIKSTARADK